MEVLPILGQHMTMSRNMHLGIIPNCLTIANTSYKNCFQYAGVLLTEFIKENALPLATNLSIVSLKLVLTAPAVGVPALILCIAKLIVERKWCYSYTDLAKNI